VDEYLRYYSIFKGSVEDPRMKQWQLRRRVMKMGYPMNRKTIAKYFRKAHEKYIIVKPRLGIYNHKNLRYYVYLLESTKPISAIEKIYSANEDSISHVIGGGNSFNVFVRARGEIDTLEFPVLSSGLCGDYVQTLPRLTCDEELVLNPNSPLKKGTFPIECRDSLLAWDSRDWKIFDKISFDPYIPYKRISEELNVHQTTVKLRFERNIIPCTYWVNAYFEKGYPNYTGAMIQIKTDYERGLYERLSRLSSSAYFLKTVDGRLFILVYVMKIKALVRYFNSLLELKRVKEFKYSVCYDYLPR
jgi:hypothetical protein